MQVDAQEEATALVRDKRWLFNLTRLPDELRGIAINVEDRKRERETADVRKMLAIYPDGRMFYEATHGDYHVSLGSPAYCPRFFRDIIACAYEPTDGEEVFNVQYSPCVLADDGVVLLAPALAEYFLAKSPIVENVVSHLNIISTAPAARCWLAFIDAQAAKRRRLRYIMWVIRQKLPPRMGLVHVERRVLEFAACFKVPPYVKP